MRSQTTFCSTLMAVALFAGCASQPAQQPAAPTTPPAAGPAERAAPETTTPTTEAEAATLLEKRFQEAAKSYKTVQKDGKTMYCKREKVIGSTIPTMQCVTEAQLRVEIQQMDQLRDRMRNNGRCTMGVGCGGGS